MEKSHTPLERCFEWARLFLEIKAEYMPVYETNGNFKVIRVTYKDRWKEV